MQNLGIFNFREALDKLEYGKPEEFMLSILCYKNDLKMKAEIIKQIIEMTPMINRLLSNISSWV